jgi:hypothetical protein
MREVIQAAGETVRPLFTLPRHLEDFLVRANRGDLRLRVVLDRSLERQLGQVERTSRRLLWGIVFAAFMIAGTTLYLNQEVVLGVAGWVLAGLSLLWVGVTGRRR